MILAIDPGSRNIGFALIDCKNRKLVFTTVHDCHTTDMAEVLDNVAQLIKTDKYEIFKLAQECIIEYQVLGQKNTNYVNHGVACAFYTGLTSVYGIKCTFMRPNFKFSVYRQFKPKYDLATYNSLVEMPEHKRKRPRLAGKLTADQRRVITKHQAAELASFACKALFDINLSTASTHEADCLGMICAHVQTVGVKDV